MTVEAHATWCRVLAHLMLLQLEVAQQDKIAVGRGQYRMHTTKSPNVKRAAHE